MKTTIETDNNRGNSLAYAIRKLTLAPLLAAFMLIYLYSVQPEIFFTVPVGKSIHVLIRQLLFLSLFPLLAYPMQPLIPAFRDKGRDGQRHLAMLFAFAGYLLNCILNTCMDTPKELRWIGWVYLLSGIMILLLNRLCGFRASGHAAGVGAVAGIPVVLGHQNALIVSLPLLLCVCWASIKMKRHTLSQFIVGLVIPIGLMILLTYLRGL